MNRESKIWFAYFIWLQSTWILQVLYSSKIFYLSFIPIFMSIAVYGLHHYYGRSPRSSKNTQVSENYLLNKYDVLNSLILIILGGFLDSLWVKFGWIKFNGTVIGPFLAPFWIIVLWFHVGLLLRVSFNWMLKRPLLGIALSFFSAFICYRAADNLDALYWKITTLSVLTIGIGWMIALPGLLFLSENLKDYFKKPYKKLIPTKAI